MLQKAQVASAVIGAFCRRETEVVGVLRYADIGLIVSQMR